MDVKGVFRDCSWSALSLWLLMLFGCSCQGRSICRDFFTDFFTDYTKCVGLGRIEFFKKSGALRCSWGVSQGNSFERQPGEFSSPQHFKSFPAFVLRLSPLVHVL